MSPPQPPGRPQPFHQHREVRQYLGHAGTSRALAGCSESRVLANDRWCGPQVTIWELTAMKVSELKGRPWKVCPRGNRHPR